MKKIAHNIQTNINKMSYNATGENQLQQIKNNFERCVIALLIQESKFNGVLPGHIDAITNKDDNDFLTYQIDLSKKALDYLWSDFEKLNSERKNRKITGLPSSIILEASLKDMMSYVGNLQGYMRVLSDAKMKLDEKQTMVTQPVTEEKVEQRVLRAPRQRIFKPATSTSPTHKP